jgi:hypothetical protein
VEDRVRVCCINWERWHRILRLESRDASMSVLKHMETYVHQGHKGFTVALPSILVPIEAFCYLIFQGSNCRRFNSDLIRIQMEPRIDSVRRKRPIRAAEFKGGENRDHSIAAESWTITVSRTCLKTGRMRRALPWHIAT